MKRAIVYLLSSILIFLAASATAEDYPYQTLEQLHYQHLYRRQIQPQPQPVIQRFVSGNTVIACVTYWTGWQWVTQCFPEGVNR